MPRPLEARALDTVNVPTVAVKEEGALGLSDEERALPLGDLITKRMKDALAMASNVKDLTAVLTAAVKWESVLRKQGDGSDDEPGSSL